MTSAAAPNILFVLADQLGARWLPMYGNCVVQTPHLCAFADQSTIVERAITTSPVCTPYRGCLLTGRYPSQTGVLENGQAFPNDETSLADRLNDGGYATHFLGKWHLSGAPQENRWVPPEARAGFQHFIGWESHHVNHFQGRIWRDDPAISEEMPGHETDALTDIALRQLEVAAESEQPFFMMVSYQAPHPPCSPPEAYRSRYDNRDLMTEPNVDASAWYDMPQWNANYDAATFRQRYFGEISQLDAAFGRLLQALDELHLRDNTLVIFTSDHGEMAGAHGLFGKGVMYEEALQVPLIIREPGQLAARRSKMPAATVDLLPTLLDYAGCTVDDEFEGISLRPWIEDELAKEDRIVFSEYKNFCAYSGRWKLVTAGRSLQHEALFDVEADPYELKNRVNDVDCAGIRELLTVSLAQWHLRQVGFCCK